MKYIDLFEYIEYDIESRKKHLNLDEPCIEIGGDSRLFRGLLAHHLGTTINNRKAYVCHACNNGACSNPSHLYWGTPKENVEDTAKDGKWESINIRTKRKYGEKEYRRILSEAGSLGGKSGGGHNKLSDAVVQERLNDFYADQIERGRVKRLSEKWNCSHTQVRRFLKKHG